MGDVGKQALQKPPGYRDPSVPAAARPATKKPQIPPALRHPGKPSRRHRTGRSCCCRLCCCIFLLIIVLIFLLTAFIGFSYLWFHPHLPSFRVENVTVPVFKITSKSDGTFLDATAIVKIQTDNPNSKLGLSCRAANGKVALVDDDGEVDLGTGSAAGFTLARKNSTAVRVTAAAKGVLVDDSVGERLKAMYKSREIRFTVEMRMKVGFVISGKSTPKIPIRVKCAAFSLNQIGSGRPLPKCDIDFFNAIF
ncbi:uncharacterized protein LOC110022289 [Phalaenopsis equestris]|uniref:uncharacterized protein LOC110022289 n=1 Tax=Phalaenopsis equestris TaxID=78828 RepID=UPI0009E42E0E|nr:uncharacterized protein LOC110022289 [Phalaenopsis equestris]